MLDFVGARGGGSCAAGALGAFTGAVTYNDPTHADGVRGTASGFSAHRSSGTPTKAPMRYPGDGRGSSMSKSSPLSSAPNDGADGINDGAATGTGTGTDRAAGGLGNIRRGAGAGAGAAPDTELQGGSSVTGVCMDAGQEDDGTGVHASMAG